MLVSVERMLVSVAEQSRDRTEREGGLSTGDGDRAA
jgi:hypothetical protein